MMRRRPIARAAVRTTAVVGTAAVVGGHMANKQAAQAQQAPAEAPLPQHRCRPPLLRTPLSSSPSWPRSRTQGRLTEEEFEAQKAKILA